MLRTTEIKSPLERYCWSGWHILSWWSGWWEGWTYSSVSCNFRLSQRLSQGIGMITKDIEILAVNPSTGISLNFIFLRFVQLWSSKLCVMCCLFTFRGYDGVVFILPAIVFDVTAGTLLTFGLYRRSRLYLSKMPLVKLIIQDGLLYFAVMFITNVSWLFLNIYSSRNNQLLFEGLSFLSPEGQVFLWTLLNCLNLTTDILSGCSKDGPLGMFPISSSTSELTGTWLSAQHRNHHDWAPDTQSKEVRSRRKRRAYIRRYNSKPEIRIF